MRTRFAYLSMLMILAVVLSACGTALAQGTQPTPASSNQLPLRTISVSGNAQVHLAPDIAYITIGVHTENANAGEAVGANNTQAQKVVDAIKGQGIDPKDIQTTNFSIYPQQQFGPQGENKGTTYMVDNSVFVTLRNLSKMGDVLTAATNAGANSIGGIQFDVADKTDALSEARATAIKNAQKIAEDTAKTAGVTLGEIQSINYGTESTPIPMFAGKGGAAVEAAAPSVPVSPGEMTISVDVSIVYSIQ